jgi:anti-sigma factor RsiW
MHQPVTGHLEEYLHGGGPFPDVEDHLKKCVECREEVEAMRAQSAMIRRVLRADAEPRAGFYAKVMNRIESQARPSVWSLFGESMFAKRLAYASATFLVLVGVVFMSSNQPAQPLASSDPEMILAGEERYTPVTMDDGPRDREVVLVNLATYQQTQQDYQ